VFIIAWNDLLIPPMLTTRAEFMTVPVAIATVGDVHVFHYLLWRSGVLALIPSVLLVPQLRRFGMQGLAAGGVRG